MADPIITVEPPRRSPRLGGLLTVAEVREESHLAASNAAQYIAEPCGVTFGDTGFCYGDLAPDEDTNKTYDGGIDTGHSVVKNWASYYGVSCFLNSDSDVEQRAVRAFDQAEDRLVETKFGAWLNLAAPIVAIPTATVMDAIGAAEDYADKNYIAQPVIHLSRYNSVVAGANEAIFGDGAGNLWTINGTPVVASSSYGNDVWVTGAVTVLRSPTITTKTETLEKNTEGAIAERVYGILVDCDFVGRFDFTA